MPAPALASFGEAGNNCSEAFSIGNRKMDNRSNIWRGVDTIKPRFVDLADRGWAMPEVCYTEAPLARRTSGRAAPPGFSHHRAGRRHSHRPDGRMGRRRARDRLPWRI